MNILLSKSEHSCSMQPEIAVVEIVVAISGKTCLLLFKWGLFQSHLTPSTSYQHTKQISPSFPDTQAKSISTFLASVCLLSDRDTCYTVTCLLQQD